MNELGPLVRVVVDEWRCTAQVSTREGRMRTIAQAVRNLFGWQVYRPVKQGDRLDIGITYKTRDQAVRVLQTLALGAL